MHERPDTPPATESGHWLDEPRNVKRLWRGFLVVLALTVLAQLVVHLHPHFKVESVFGFHAWFGFLACAAMIVVAKALALLLKRPDSYYGERHD
jgi:hypothetical protein